MLVLTLKKLNKEATAIFVAIIERLKTNPTSEGYLKLDNNKPDSALMPLHVEDHNQTVMLSGMEGHIYSMAHYYRQEGDNMSDPDVQFIMVDNRKEAGDLNDLNFVGVYPYTFQQDSMSIFRQSANIENGKVTTFRPREQKDLVSFCNMWMGNIKWQQSIKPATHKPKGQEKMKGIIQKMGDLATLAKQLGFSNIAEAVAAGKGDELIALAKTSK